MSLAFGQTEFRLPPPSLRRRAIPSRHHHLRVRKRRRLKPLCLNSDLNPTPSPFENLFQSLLSLFPSTNAINYIAPTLGLASGVALYLSSDSSKRIPNHEANRNSDYDIDIGEWILFTSPTPFNRFVTLRCPTIYFPGNELLEDVNEKLVKEDRHFVKLNSGRMIQFSKSDAGIHDNMGYQRICVGTEDGGVISLDWPENLVLEEERGLDTTVLIVPGTAEGSNERKIRGFVRECLRRGVFPIVMNPRGCAGSPLTTARFLVEKIHSFLDRLFTAADSDDISTAIQFIVRKRPWTTMMGVGWGYGANMLTKYLAEFGERTPLTAATCIDNPFDLEEATRSSVNHIDFDQRHTSGLISILQSNKELFQGPGKGFDVKRALSALSIRDFDEAISMVSYGFDTIEDFYAKSSTRDMVGKLKIPVLFIQNDEGTVPVISIPRSLIAENPYTSLLLCSYSPYSKVMDDRLTLSWCQSLIIEWLTAVELGLLKGRHPLLKDVDFTINPSKGLALVESGTTGKNDRADKLLNFTNGHFANSPSETFEANDMAGFRPRPTQDIEGLPSKTKELEKEGDKVIQQSSSTVDAETVEDETNSLDNERGQVLQSAQVVMNMLDVTMPNTLSDEQKKKVLSAVGQGETIVKALQDAVPEDVRGKLTGAVSGILQSRRSDINFEKLLRPVHIPDVASGLKSKGLEKIGPPKPNSDENFHSSDQKKKSNDIDDLGGGSVKVDQSSGNLSGDVEKPVKTNGDEEVQVPDIKKRSDDLGDGSGEADRSSSKFPQDVELVGQLSENSVKHTDRTIYQSTSNPGSSSSDLKKVNSKGMENSPENEQLPKSSTTQVPDGENVPEISTNREQSSLFGGPSGKDGVVSDQNKEERDSSDTPLEMESTDDHKHDLSTDKTGPPEANHTDDKSPAPASSPTSETLLKENETENQQKNEEEKTSQSLASQNNGAPPGFSVSEALNALTGFDDSTQVAVNSVFHVIEDMINQLELEKENENEVENGSKSDADGIDEVTELREESASENHLKNNGQKSGKTTNLSSNTGMESGISDGTLLHDHYTHGGNNSNSDTSTTKSFCKENVIGTAADHSVENVPASFNSSPEMVRSYATTLPYGDPLYREYLRKYLYLKMRNSTPLDVDKTSALYLDYIPEEDQWKLLEREEDNGTSADKCTSHEGGGFNNDPAERPSGSKHHENIIEPSYVIFDSGKPQEGNQEIREVNMVDKNIVVAESKLDDSVLLVKNLISESLNIEVGRRANAADIDKLKDKLSRDVERVANTVATVAEHEWLQMETGHDNFPNNPPTLNGENIIKAISFAVPDTQYLSKVLPIGVIVGTSLAALRKCFNVVSLDDKVENHLALDQVGLSREDHTHVGVKQSDERLLKESENKDDSDSFIVENEDKIDLENSKNDELMVGAVTAALGASALIVHQQTTGTNGISNEPLKEKENSKEPSKLEEMPEKNHNNIITSLAEKAMSVASPVVPTKDGELDHERLVAMLAELGQKGGILKLVGKVALLWGGIRGAMSLADKLISFLRIAERPVFQRILGFVFMVLLLWSPVVVPLLPTLMQSWATRNPLRIAEFACLVGLYVSSTIMVTLWGKRIRKFDDPLLQYGLDLTSIPKIQNILIGLIGGAILVLLIHSVNSAIGCVHLCWPTSLSSSSSEPLALMKSYGRMLWLIVQGIAAATNVAIIEELLFRSWLPEEIAADLGYHQGIIISGLVFALCQRSTWEIPALWLLSLSFAGARQRTQGSLSIPIGLRTGILASNFILKTGGFVTYQPNFPVWVTGGHVFRPFGGVVGLAFSLVLAVILYPREPLRSRKPRVIRD